MVLSAPRSASTWVANWLTTEKSLCLHDPILEHKPEDLDAITSDRVLGLSCTGLALLPEFVNAHPARKVIVHRPLETVNRSLVSIGLAGVGANWVGALYKIGGMHVAYEDLFNPLRARTIHKYLMQTPFDGRRHAQLCAMHVEPHFPKVQVQPDRAREFRARVLEVFS